MAQTDAASTPSASLMRDTTLDDIPDVQAIYAHHVQNGTASFELSPPDIATMVERFQHLKALGYPHRVLVDAEGQIGGYAYASAYRPRPAYQWTVESTVYVHPNHQRKGYGRLMLTDLIPVCEARGYRQMIAVIGGSDHVASIELHRAFGFEVAGTLKSVGYKHDQWLDSVIMQRAIGAGATTPPNTL